MKFWQHQENARAATRQLLWAFAGAVLVLLAAVHGVLALAWWLMALLLPVPLSEPAGFLVVNVGVSLLLVLGGWWVETSSLCAGGLKFAARMGAREARPAVSHAEQRLCNIVDGLCIAAHMPRPQAMVLPRAEAINAFAANWDASDAVVAVTQGALDYLTREGLQGGLAHPAVQHLLLVDVPGHSALERRLDAHPPLQERVQRIYGRRMAPLPLARVPISPEPAGIASAAPAGSEAGAVTLASLVDLFARL